MLAAALGDEAVLLVQRDRGCVARVDVELDPRELVLGRPLDGGLEQCAADALPSRIGAHRHPERRDVLDRAPVRQAADGQLAEELRTAHRDEHQRAWVVGEAL